MRMQVTDFVELNISKESNTLQVLAESMDFLQFTFDFGMTTQTPLLPLLIHKKIFVFSQYKVRL